MKKEKLVHWFIITTFVSLYLAVSVISTLHVIRFFELSNPYWLAVSLAVAFELGAAASLASLIVLDKMNKALVWALFITLTLFQSMGNIYYAYVNLHDFAGWVELFDLVDEDLIYQKRILSIISGGILPFVALGFIKSLVDYIRPKEEITEEISEKIEDQKPAEESVLNGGEVVDTIETKPEVVEVFSEPEPIQEEVKQIEEEIIEIQDKVEVVNDNIEEESQPSQEIGYKGEIQHKEMTPEEVASIIASVDEEFIDDDEDDEDDDQDNRPEILVDANVPIPIPRKDPNQSY